MYYYLYQTPSRLYTSVVQEECEEETDLFKYMLLYIHSWSPQASG